MDSRQHRSTALATSACMLLFAGGALLQRQCALPFPGTVLAAEQWAWAPAGSAAGRGRFPVYTGNGAGWMQWHPVAGHVHVPNAAHVWDWPEYERGAIRPRTNNLGLRRDTPTETIAPRGTFRVLVLGDSHSDGLVDNDHTYCHLLEQGLVARQPGVPIEVLNAAVMATGPHHYAGQAERFFGHDVDLYVVCLYGSNDFLNAAVTSAVRGITPIPERTPQQRARIDRVRDVRATQQGPSQVRWMLDYPDLRAPTMREVEQQMRWLRRVVRWDGAELLVVSLPSRYQCEWPRWPEERRAKAAARQLAPLLLTVDDLALNRALTEQLLGWLEREGFSCLDLLPALRDAPGKLFWNTDYHLAPAGHAAVAAALVPVVAARMAAR